MRLLDGLDCAETSAVLHGATSSILEKIYKNRFFIRVLKIFYRPLKPKIEIDVKNTGPASGPVAERRRVRRCVEVHGCPVLGYSELLQTI